MNPSEIANRIEILCQKSGITISKMLLACSLSKSVVDNLKKGSIPSADKISAIASYFNVTTDYLLGNEQKNKPVTDRDRLSEEDKKIIELLHMVPAEDRKMLVGMIEGALKSRGLLR